MPEQRASAFANPDMPPLLPAFWKFAASLTSDLKTQESESTAQDFFASLPARECFGVDAQEMTLEDVHCCAHYTALATKGLLLQRHGVYAGGGRTGLSMGLEVHGAAAVRDSINVRLHCPAVQAVPAARFKRSQDDLVNRLLALSRGGRADLPVFEYRLVHDGPSPDDHSLLASAYSGLYLLACTHAGNHVILTL